MAPLEAILVWISLALYAVTSALYIYSFIFKNEKMIDRLVYFIGTSFAFHTSAILARYQAVGNLPVASDYESGLGGGWVVALITLYVCFRHRSLRAVGVASVPFTLLMLGYGVMRSPVLVPMSASVKSFWLYIHVLFAWLAYGAFAITAAMGVIYIFKDRNPEKDFYRKFPDFGRLEDLMFKYLIFGFITDAVMIASGAIWAKNLWGNYWSWDPVETWSLVTWAIYGIAIHLRVTMGWKGKKFAWLLIFSLSGMVITYFGINFFVETSLHFFEAWQEI